MKLVQSFSEDEIQIVSYFYDCLRVFPCSYTQSVGYPESNLSKNSRIDSYNYASVDLKVEYPISICIHFQSLHGSLFKNQEPPPYLNE